MNYEDTRDALVGAFHTYWGTAYPSTPVFYENTDEVDLDVIAGGEFLTVEIDFTNTTQMEMRGEQMTKSIEGLVWFRFFIKGGEGSRRALVVATDLDAALSGKTLASEVTTGVLTPGRKYPQKGWLMQEFKLPFRTSYR